MKIKVKDVKNGEKGSLSLPRQFSEEIRIDLISRAVHTIASHKRQPYGADPEAGKKSSAELSRRRRKYRGSYGHGISRVPRKILSRSGTRFNWVGAFAPGTIGGRRAHPPKAEKIWALKINDKERQKAIRSALAATMNKELVASRGHRIPTDYPFAVSDDFEKIAKTKDVLASLKNIGFDDEVERCKDKTIRAGKGKLRGRKYRRKTGVLLVVSEQCPLELSAANLPGIDVVKVNELNASLLAPGTDVGRATIFTENALKTLEEQNLFYPKTRMLKEVVKITKKASKAALSAVKKKEAKSTKKAEKTKATEEVKETKETKETKE